MKNSLRLALTLIFTLSNSMTSMADALAVHGMVLFGDQTTYASHLPMFHAPHDHQAVFQIVLENNTRKPTVELYEELKKTKNGQSLFTLQPEEFDLTELISKGSGKIKATLYDGHFEKGGTPIGTVWVNVSKVVYSQELSKDSLPNEEFIVFGAGDEHYAVKKIGAVGSYDAIVSVDHPQQRFAGCWRRVCDESDYPGRVGEVPDWVLPITLKANGLTPPKETPYQFEIPSEGVTLSDRGRFATIKDVIYASKDDLSH